MTSLAHVRTWIFDLDNTLYPAATNLFALVDATNGYALVDYLDRPTREGLVRTTIARAVGLDPSALTS